MASTPEAGDPDALSRELTAIGARAGLDFEVQIVDGRARARLALLNAMRRARRPVVILMDAS